MIVEAHVVRLGEGGLYRVVTGGAVRGVPVSDRGTGAHGQDAALLGEAGVVQHLAGLLFLGIDLPLPALRKDAAVLDGHRSVLAGRRLCGHERAGTQSKRNCNRGTVNETHGMSSHKMGPAFALRASARQALTRPSR